MSLASPKCRLKQPSPVLTSDYLQQLSVGHEETLGKWTFPFSLYHSQVDMSGFGGISLFQWESMALHLLQCALRLES